MARLQQQGDATSRVAYALDGTGSSQQVSLATIGTNQDLEMRVGADHENRSGAVEVKYAYIALTAVRL